MSTIWPTWNAGGLLFFFSDIRCWPNVGKVFCRRTWTWRTRSSCDSNPLRSLGGGHSIRISSNSYCPSIRFCRSHDQTIWLCQSVGEKSPSNHNGKTPQPFALNQMVSFLNSSECETEKINVLKRGVKVFPCVLNGLCVNNSMILKPFNFTFHFSK